LDDLMPIAPRLGLSVFIVEDEPLLAMMLEEFLDELGCSVAGYATSVPDALSAIPKVKFDVAILDVHLRGQPVWPMADRLQREGRPFIISSGDNGRNVQARYPGATFLSKPYQLDALSHALQMVQPSSKP
jgi:CheY-like chemotaxis protein